MISFAVTAFNEFTKPRGFGKGLLGCIRAAQQHSDICEVVIVNDLPGDREDLESLLHGQPKVRLIHNQENLGVFTNKLEAVAQSKNEWVITCDSDNVMDQTYLDLVIASIGNSDVWLCASFAKPHFDYRKLVGTYSIKNVGTFLSQPTSHCAFNTGNQTLHRQKFLEVFQSYRGIRRFDLLLPNHLSLPEGERQKEETWLSYGACDSFLYNMLWVLAGNRIVIKEGLEYQHRVHSVTSGSNYDRAPAMKAVLNNRLVQILQKKEI